MINLRTFDGFTYSYNLKMKKIALGFIGLGMLTACQQTANISGTLSGIESDTIMANIYIPGQDKMSVDTIPMQNGKFAYNIGDSVIKMVYIYAKPSAGNETHPANIKAANFMLIPGKPVKITGSLDNYRLEGDSFYEDYSKILNDCQPYMQKIDSLTGICLDLEKRIGTDGITADSIRQVYAPARDLVNAMLDVKKDYIRQNPDNDLSVFLLSTTSLKIVTEYIDSIAERTQNGIMAPLYRVMKQDVDIEKTRDQAQEAIATGAPAPDFTVKDLEGKDFTLSSLKGKYVVLDFWGSWCGWCIKGIPEMKKYYEKYKGRIEFVGIDCNDTEEAWKKAVEEHKLPWINVRNDGNPDVSMMYGVSGYPTKFIIDPEGKIDKKIVGEDPEFYKYLDAIMK